MVPFLLHESTPCYFLESTANLLLLLLLLFKCDLFNGSWISLVSFNGLFSKAICNYISVSARLTFSNLFNYSHRKLIFFLIKQFKTLGISGVCHAEHGLLFVFDKNVYFGSWDIKTGRFQCLVLHFWSSPDKLSLIIFRNIRCLDIFGKYEMKVWRRHLSLFFCLEIFENNNMHPSLVQSVISNYCDWSPFETANGLISVCGARIPFSICSDKTFHNTSCQTLAKDSTNTTERSFSYLWIFSCFCCKLNIIYHNALFVPGL